MMTKSWIRSLFARSSTRPIHKVQHGVRLVVEALEDRTVPSRFAGLLDGGPAPSPPETGGAASTGAFPSTAHVFFNPGSASALSQMGGSGSSPPVSIPYNGGSLLTHVQVQGVYYNDPTTLGFQSQMDGFFTNIVQSPWVTHMLANFSVGNQTIGAGAFLGDDVTGLTFQGLGLIQSQLSSELAQGRLAGPNGNTLYAVFVPSGSLGGQALGYHTAFIDPSSGKVIYYMVIDSAQDPNFTEFQGRTVITSHELSEAITDPGTGLRTPTQPGGDWGWVSLTQGYEIGDVSEGTELVTYHGYVMQEEWGRSPTDPPLLALGPIMAPANTDLAVGPISNPTEGAYHGILATFNDGDGASESPSQFTVTVSWGDATFSTSKDGSGDVIVTSNGDGTFNVSGRHTYNGEAGSIYGGHFPGSNSGITGASVLVNSGDEVALTTQPITLQEAGPLTNVSAHSFGFVSGQALTNQVVATFTDPGGKAGADLDVSEYQASINWGDGTPRDTNVTILPNGNGRYLVLGNHTYTSTGPYPVSVTVTHDGATNVVVGQAATTIPTYFTVTSLLDDGSMGTLRWAISQANAAVGMATINFAGALFDTPQTILLSGAPLELSNTRVTENIAGPAAGVTVSGAGLSRVLQVDAAVSASFSHLTIIGGKTAGSGGGLENVGGIITLTNCTLSGNSAGSNGAGLDNSSGVATLTNCTVSNNASTHRGGGMFSDGPATLTNCTVSGNSAPVGGGMYSDGPAALTNCTVSGNSADVAGGLYNIGTETLTNCTVSGNSAGVVGGGLVNGSSVYFNGYSRTGTAALSNCTVSGNTAQYAGGIFNGGPATLVNCKISGNDATSIGGGMLNEGPATLIDCTVSGNSAMKNGGGLFNYATATLNNCTVSGNTAGTNGGGLNSSFGSSTTLKNCTVSGNNAFQGGGLANFVATAALTDCTVSGNSAVNGGGMETYSGNTTLTHCTVTGNSATNNGGGVDNFGTQTTTLTNCTVSGNSARLGGGLSNFGRHTVTLTNCSISGNSATRSGGGLRSYGTATLTNCTVSGNNAARIGGGLENFGTATLIDCTVSGNNATRSGGGLFNYGSATLNNCTVSKNSSARNGGGLASADRGATATLTNCTVSGNSATLAGGGLSVIYYSTTSLNNCTVSGNTAGTNGGGLYNSYGSSTALKSCTVSGNKASANGGGLANSGGTAALTNCTVTGDSAVNGGGVSTNGYAGYYGNLTGTTSLTNCTVSGNTASNAGGGLYSAANLAALTSTNTIVAGNTNAAAANDISGPALGANDLIGTGGAGGLANGVNGNLVGVANVLLAPLGNYGGPTQTIPLLPGSPAIDAGSSTGAPTLDQRGKARVGAVDIGAFESQGFTMAVASGAGQSTDISTAFQTPLVMTVTANNPGEPVAGGLVTFTAPASGASVMLSGNPAIISAPGAASVAATANGSAGSYTVSATAHGVTTPASLTLSNRPTITVPTTQTAYEDVDKTITGISVGDGASATVTVTLHVSHGTLTLPSVTGLSVTGAGTGSVTLTGSTANLDAALATLVYRGVLNYSGGDTLSVTAIDGGVSALPASVAINVVSAAQQATAVQAQISALQSAGVFNQGQANSLIVKLNLKGNNGDIGKVQAFLNEVQADVGAGKLTQAQADALLKPGNILLLSVTRR